MFNFCRDVLSRLDLKGPLKSPLYPYFNVNDHSSLKQAFTLPLCRQIDQWVFKMEIEFWKVIKTGKKTCICMC